MKPKAVSKIPFMLRLTQEQYDWVSEYSRQLEMDMTATILSLIEKEKSADEKWRLAACKLKEILPVATDEEAKLNTGSAVRVSPYHV